MKINTFLRSLLTLFLLVSVNSLWAKISVVDLRCEYKINPLGIDILSPRLSWKLSSDEYNVTQSAFEIKVAASIPDLKKDNMLIWTSGKVMSDQSVNVAYENAGIKSMKRMYWQVRCWNQNGKVSAWSEPAFWEMGILNSDEWQADWITYPDVDKEHYETVSPYLRHTFKTNKKIKSARVYASALGLYELYLNGDKVGDELFTPGWTSYKNRIQYQTYDVTKVIQTENALSAKLGKGWYKGHIGWEGTNGYYGQQTAFILQLSINYEDGTSELISTDKNWKLFEGGIVDSEIYNGETYNAVQEPKEWDMYNFDDSKWKSAVVFNYTKETLIAPQGVPVKAIEEIKPINILKTPKGEVVLDMGQNMVGWVRLKVIGEKGHKVTLKFAEVLNKEGNFYTENLRSAKATDVYILNGEGTEVFEPHFTFHGFRFVQVIDYPGEITKDAITGIVIHSDMEKTGEFSCSDSLINQLQHNIQWGQKGNFLDVPTDCPQRDERLGWTGDAQAFFPTAAFNFDVSAFFTKWLGDVAADQTSDGRIPHVIPDVLNGGGGATGWSDACIVIPWNMYLAYGDVRILEKQYESMKAWVEYMRKQAGSDLLWTENWHFGDWLAFATTQSDYQGATTDKGLIATAYFKYSSSLLAKIAHVIGKTNDANEYDELANGIKKAFNTEFVTPSGRLVSHTQTAYSLALAFDLLPDDLIDKAAEYLAVDVRSFKHLTTGFLGTPLLCKSLSDYGNEDLAFMLLKRKEYPSWLYPVTQGATTIWERWDGQKPDGTFQNIGMNSFNHYAYGAIGEWMYSYIAGINIDENKVGYKHIYLTPHIGGGLTNASASIKTLYGEVKSTWTLNGQEVDYNIQIPANTTATVTLENVSIDKIEINSKALSEFNSLATTKDDGNTSIELGSGEYQIKY